MAAGAVKGITIEIGGDTTKLDKALSGVNKNSKDLQSELKQVNQLLKFDPKNTELLTQKQELLKRAIGETKEKLSILKDAEKQVQAQFERGDITEKQYRELQREIIATEGTLKGLENAAKESNLSLEKVSEATAKISEKSEALGKKLLPVSGAIVGVGAASIAAFNEVDSGYDTIITKTGATGEVLEGLQDSMDNVFAELPIEAEAAGIAVGEVNTRFGETGETLEDLSKRFVEFAEINDADLNQSIGETDKIMEQFGVSSDKTASVLGLLTSKSQETGIGVDVLMSDVQKSGAVFKEMGLNLEESIVFLAELEKNGVNADTAIAGLRKSVANYTKDGKSTEEGLQLTIDSIKNATTETEAMTIASEVFGNKGAAEMSRAIREGRLSVDDLGVLLEDYATVVTDTFNATLDPPDQAKVAFNNLKLAGAELGSSLMAALKPALDKVVESVKKFTDWFKNLSDSQKETIIKIGGLIAVLAPALIIFGKVTQGISRAILVVKKIKTAIAGAKVAFAAFNLVLAANPIVLIVAGIVALIAGIVLLYTKCKWFRDAVNAVLTSVKAAFFVVFDAIKKFFTETVPNILNTALDFFKWAWNGIITVFKGVGQWFADIFTEAYMAIVNVFSPIVEWFAPIFESIQNLAAVLCQWVALKFQEAYTGITRIFSGIGQWFGSCWQDVKNALSTVATWFSTMFQTAYSNVMTAFSPIGQWFGARWQGVKNALSTVASWFSTMFQSAYSNVMTAFSPIGQWFTDKYNDIINIFKEIPNAFKGFFDAAWENIKGAFSGVTDFFEGIRDTIVGFFNGIADRIKDEIKEATNATNKNTGSSNKNGRAVPMFANGGILRNGRGIIAEAGPELIEMVNGAAIITPMNGYARNTSVAAQGAVTEGFKQVYNFYSPKALDPYETARLARNATRSAVLKLQGV